MTAEKQARERDVRTWITACEQRFSEQLQDVAQTIAATESLKLLRLSGPTCSGKTTLADLLCRQLAQQGKRVHLISIDDFYYDNDFLQFRSDASAASRTDYDSVDTIDLAMLSTFVREIFTLEQADCPIFDFSQGKRTGMRRMKSRREDLFLFEGIQSLYPEVTRLVSEYGTPMDLYIAPEQTVSVGDCRVPPHELRLLRRLVRDHRFRGTSPEQTFALWEGVRRNEEANIFPYVTACRYRLDSAMPYELGVLKPILDEILPSVPHESPYRAQAEAILTQLRDVEPIDEAWVPADSLYREFIGQP